MPVGVTLAFLLGTGLSSAAVIKVDPNTMLVEGVHSNTHIVTPNPHFSWTVPSGTQTNWQIQIDSDPNFNGHFGQIWFWDSGSGSKGGQEGATNVQYASISAPGFFPRSIDTRADLIYWRLRVQINNDPNWNTDPAYFSTGVFKLNLIPLSSDNVAAADEPTPGAVPATVFPALNPSPKEFFVSPTGDDANAGTLALPFKTISKGVTVLNPGDTLSVLTGVYNENVRLTPTPTGVKNGTPGNPITIRARPLKAGDQVIVRGVTVGTQPFAPFQFVGASSSIQYWILDGVKLGGTGAAVGVYFNFADFITLKNLSFESTFNPSGTGIQILGGGLGNRVLNSVFDTKMFDMLENGGSKYLEVRGNEFKNQNGHVAIHWHNSGSQGGIIEGNSFHDLVTTEGGIFAYLSCDGLVVRDNLFYNISEATNGYAAGLVPLRCGKVLVENNTFVNNRRGIGINEFARFLIIRNNIFFNNQGPALDFTPLQSAQQGSSTVGTVVANNISFNNLKDADFFYPQDANVVTFLSNCFGGPKPSSNLACDPKFVNAGANDFHLAAGSPAIDAGDPNVPTPIGGGAAPDIGALESGASAMPPYDFQPRVTLGDVTPRFSWTLVDRDNDLHLLFPASFTDFDTQAGFQLQVDTKNTFDSVNGSRPAFDSGTVLSAVPSYTVPDLNALAPGDYYMRVRLRDENTGLLGAWSNNDFRVRVAQEPTPPALAQQNPAPGAFGVVPTTSVSAHVVDFGAGVNSGTIVMHLGINNSNAPTLVSPAITQSGATPADFLVTFTPAANLFSSGDVITVRIEADDLFVPPNHMDQKYSFTVKDTTPPASPTNLRVVP